MKEEGNGKERKNKRLERLETLHAHPVQHYTTYQIGHQEAIGEEEGVRAREEDRRAKGPQEEPTREDNHRDCVEKGSYNATLARVEREHHVEVGQGSGDHRGCRNEERYAAITNGVSPNNEDVVPEGSAKEESEEIDYHGRDLGLSDTNVAESEGASVVFLPLGEVEGHHHQKKSDEA